MLEKFGLEISERAQQGAAWLDRRFPQLAGTFEGIAELAIRRGGNDAMQELRRRDEIYDHTMLPVTTMPRNMVPQPYIFRFPGQDAARPSFVENPLRGDNEEQPVAVAIKGGNHLYAFPDRGVFLSTVSHNMCGGGGDCVPKALWAVPHFGAKPYDQILLDLQRAEYNTSARDENGRIIKRDIMNPLTGVSDEAFHYYLNKHGNSMYMANQKKGEIITDPEELHSYISSLNQQDYTGLLGVLVPESVTGTRPEKHTFALINGQPVGASLYDIPQPIGRGGEYEFDQAWWMTRPAWKDVVGMRPAPALEAKIAAAAKRQGFYTDEVDEDGMPIPYHRSSFLRSYDPSIDGRVTLDFGDNIPRRKDD